MRIAVIFFLMILKVSAEDFKDYFVIPEKWVYAETVKDGDEEDFTTLYNCRKIQKGNGEIHTELKSALGAQVTVYSFTKDSVHFIRDSYVGEDYEHKYTAEKPMLIFSDEMVNKKEGVIEQEVIMNSVIKEGSNAPEKEKAKSKVTSKWKHFEEYSGHKNVIVVNSETIDKEGKYQEKSVFVKGKGLVYYKLEQEDFSLVKELINSETNEIAIVNFMKLVLKKVNAGDNNIDQSQVARFYHACKMLSDGDMNKMKEINAAIIKKRAPELIKDMPLIHKFLDDQRKLAQKKANLARSKSHIMQLSTSLAVYLLDHNNKLPEKIEDLKSYASNFDTISLCKVTGKKIQYIRAVDKVSAKVDHSKIVVFKALTDEGEILGYLDGSVKFVAKEK